MEQNGRVKGGNEVGIWKLYDGFVYNQVIFSICCPSITFNGHGVVGRIKHNGKILLFLTFITINK